MMSFLMDVVLFLLLLLLSSPTHLQGFTSCNSMLFHKRHRRWSLLGQHQPPESPSSSSSMIKTTSEYQEEVKGREEENFSSSDVNQQETMESDGRNQQSDSISTETFNASSHEVVLCEYINSDTKKTIIASIGSEKEKLELFSIYKFGRNCSKSEMKAPDGGRLHVFRQRNLDLNDDETKKTLLELWRNENLLSQSSDPLNVLHSKSKFEDLLLSYALRIEMLRNESVKDSLLLDFLAEQNIHNMTWTHYLRNSTRDYNTTLAVLKDLAVWFRSQFPYYYDACLMPGCGNKVNNSFTGYIYPNKLERKDKAGRTELYLCGKCGGQHRFPRFNNVIKVLETRRGRCGEYSVLFLRILRLLGYQVRWVVDWADHVWVEALYSNGLSGQSNDRRWIHADPCEAAVDEPLLYESWGKNQTYILAFSDIAADNAAFALSSERLRSSYNGSIDVLMPKQYHGAECYHDGNCDDIGDQLQDTIAVVDMTAAYTSDIEAAFNRRDVRGDDFIKALNGLRAKMKEIPDR